MNKLFSLLNESTIIDIRFLSLLIKRYKSHLLFAIFLLTGLFLYKFYTQPLTSEVSIPIKHIVGHKASSDLSSFNPIEARNAFTLEELTITLSSSSFLKFTAGLILQDESFDKLNFGNIKEQRPFYGYELKKNCQGDNACVVNHLANLIDQLFFVEQGLNEDRFLLKINALDKATSIILARVLAKTIVQERLKVLRYSVLKEIDSVGSLIQESRSMIDKNGGYKSLEEQERLHNNIADLKDKIRMLQQSLSSENVVFNSLEAKLSENKKTAERTIIIKDNLEKYSKIQTRLNELKLNLNALLSVPEDQKTAADKIFIAHLLNERMRLLREVPSEIILKQMELKDVFTNKQRESANNYEFDFLVSKNKITKLEFEFTSSKVKLNELMQQKLLNENKVNGMKTDLDFLKDLNSKHSSLKLLSATINSDLVLEESNGHFKEFRKFGFLKVLIFSFAFTSFIYIFSLVVRYCNDDKIYGEEDIKMYFKDLDFVGEVPSFR